LSGTRVVVCAQQVKETIHGNTLLAKSMTEGQFTSRHTDEFTFFRLDYCFQCGICFAHFLGICNRFHFVRYRSTPIAGLGDL
jgi:heterodisulfide reductase subunit C